MLSPVTILSDQEKAIHDKSIVLVGSEQFMPECNIVAMMHEFPNLGIYQTSRLSPAVDRIDPLPAAILIDDYSLARMAEPELATLYSARNALAAVVVENPYNISEVAETLVAGKHIHSILPMNLRLETWLLAVRLLLKGGSFAPTSMVRTRLQSNRRPGPERFDIALPGPPAAPVSGLTGRELQVLHMLASGSPNRLIADRFQLSEHTVKMHVHNVIKKLKAPNRTTAAAIYLENLSKLNGPFEDPSICGEGA